MNTFKKLSATMMMAALMASFTTACSSDDNVLEGDVAGEEATFNITCIAPAPTESSTGSRTYSDGQTADCLWYALYVGNYDATQGDTVYSYVGGNLPTLAGAETTMGTSDVAFNAAARPKATINLSLIVGKRYMLIALGAAKNAPYVIDKDTKTLKVDYTSALCSDESRDAFYRMVKFQASKQKSRMTVTLTRPFAQVNVGTAAADWAEADLQGCTPTKTKFVVKQAYKTLNLVDGSVSDPVDATFALNALPAATETFPVTGYNYLSMVYVLVGADSGQTFDCTFAADTFEATGDEWSFENVPMQRNHRTNIYGDGILTFDSNVTIEIDPNYLSDDYNYDAATGFVNGENPEEEYEDPGEDIEDNSEEGEEPEAEEETWEGEEEEEEEA
jgi:hypothetical protein